MHSRRPASFTAMHCACRHGMVGSRVLQRLCCLITSASVDALLHIADCMVQCHAACRPGISRSDLQAESQTVLHSSLVQTDLPHQQSYRAESSNPSRLFDCHVCPGPFVRQSSVCKTFHRLDTAAVPALVPITPPSLLPPSSIELCS